jgi:hypothetical protein
MGCVEQAEMALAMAWTILQKNNLNDEDGKQ